MSEINLGQVVGPRGPQGIQGIKGDKGDQGIQGVVGPKVDVAASLGTSTVYAVSQKLLTDEVDKMTTSIATIKSQSDESINTVSSFDERTLNTQVALNYLSKFLVNQAGLPANGLYADFVNNVYLHDGILISFNDLFTFTRAGKAWLVKETGLQEYAADVPRLDNGLLIEQSATNLISNNTTLSTGDWRYSNTGIPDTNGFFRFIDDGSPRLANLSIFGAVAGVQASLSVVIGRPTAPVTLTTHRASGPLSGVVVEPDFSVRAINSLPCPVPTAVGAVVVKDIAQVGLSRSYVADAPVTGTSCVSVISADEFKVKLPQWEIGDNFTSSIPTTTTPVTRPADYLLNKITGTAVTGDWDSTLTLSIVNGQLVHSGYGKIRSLEIN